MKKYTPPSMPEAEFRASLRAVLDYCEKCLGHPPRDRYSPQRMAHNLFDYAAYLKVTMDQVMGGKWSQEGER